MTRRHWVYWRSAYRGINDIWATRLDPDGKGYTRRSLYPALPDEHLPWADHRIIDGWCWCISKAEAERLAAERERQA